MKAAFFNKLRHNLGTSSSTKPTPAKSSNPIQDGSPALHTTGTVIHIDSLTIKPSASDFFDTRYPIPWIIFGGISPRLDNTHWTDTIFNPDRESRQKKTRKKSNNILPKSRSKSKGRTFSHFNADPTLKIQKKVSEITFHPVSNDHGQGSGQFQLLTTETVLSFDIPLPRKKHLGSDRTKNMSANVNSEKSEDSGTKDSTSSQPVVVRVTSDHVTKNKSDPEPEKNENKDDKLNVPDTDSKEKKRKSTETLTAQMDFGDEDDES